MAKPNIGLPERPATRARGGCGWRLTGVLFLLFLLFTCGLVVFFLMRPPTNTLPNVIIYEPLYGAELIAGQPLPVMASASSVGKIVKQSLWVDGLEVYVAVTSDLQGQKDFVAALLWTPKSGTHTLVARALDARGNVGTSPVVRVNVTESAAQLPQNFIQIIEQGDTIDSLAKENGVTPDQLRQANPGLPNSPPLGGWVNIPPGNDQQRGSDDQPGGGINDPGAVPIPPGIDVGPANPNPGFWGFEPPLLFWGTPANIAPLAPDLNVTVANCTATLTWRDNSNNESGFYIYRLNRGAGAFSRIATIAANNAHAALRYQDSNVGGDYQYYVAAYSNIGESGSRIVSVNIPGQNCWHNLGAQVLEVEMSSLTISVPTEEAYCYASLKGYRPFERVPLDPFTFLKFMGPRAPQADFLMGQWDVREHYAGANKRIVTAPEGGQPFRVEVECWAARVTNEGGESYSLGRFDQSHPPAEWDGRALTGRGNSFTLVYHIRPWSGPSGNPNTLLDPDIPPPFNLRRARDFNDCLAHSPGDAGSLLGCAMAEYPDKAPLVWEWNGSQSQIDGYRVYFNRMPVGGTFVPIFDGNKDIRAWVGPSQIPCGETWRYAVSAFDLNAESRLSEFIALNGPECNDLALVEVELEAIKTGQLDDGIKCDFLFVGCTVDTTMETYGNADFVFGTEPGVVRDTQGVRLVDSVEPVKFKSHRTIRWADLPLCRLVDDIGCLGWGRNQNKMVFLLRGDEWMFGYIALKDADSGLNLGTVSGPFNGDDFWCYAEFNLPSMSIDEWARLDQTLDRNGGNVYGDCSLRVRVRGLGRASGSRVLIPGGAMPAMTGKNANLRVINIDRNRQGNARITLYNAGPDTLINDTVTLQFQVARVASGAGGSPPMIAEHEERAQLTIPAFGQTTIDTGQTLLQGFENRVRVTITAVNFTDPDLRDNVLCRRIDVPDLAHVRILECAQ